MGGIVVFKTLAEALRLGYQVYDRTASGYVVRIKIDGLWSLALVELK